MQKTISERAAAGAVALLALSQPGFTATSILTAYAEHRGLDDDAMTTELEGTVGDLLSDVLHALCEEQYPHRAELGQQIPAVNLVLSRFHQLEELLSDLVLETFGAAPDYLFRAFNHYHAEQEESATLLSHGA